MSTLCPTCHGSGDVGAPTSDDDPTCPECDGEGRVTVSTYDPQVDYEVPCPACNEAGEGFTMRELAAIETRRLRAARLHSWTCDCPICDSRNAAADAANDLRRDA